MGRPSSASFFSRYFPLLTVELLDLVSARKRDCSSFIFSSSFHCCRFSCCVCFTEQPFSFISSRPAPYTFCLHHFTHRTSLSINIPTNYLYSHPQPHSSDRTLMSPSESKQSRDRDFSDLFESSDPRVSLPSMSYIQGNAFAQIKAKERERQQMMAEAGNDGESFLSSLSSLLLGLSVGVVRVASSFFVPVCLSGWLFCSKPVSFSSVAGEIVDSVHSFFGFVIFTFFFLFIFWPRTPTAPYANSSQNKRPGQARGADDDQTAWTTTRNWPSPCQSLATYRQQRPSWRRWQHRGRDGPRPHTGRD